MVHCTSIVSAHDVQNGVSGITRNRLSPIKEPQFEQIPY